MIEQSQLNGADFPLTIGIFSYNRGQYLKNLLDSIDRHIPMAKVVIYDDNSDDRLTQRVLAETHHTVSHCWDSAAGKRHGNLYGNMQKALDDCTTPLLLFLQDDTQIVRDLDQGTLDTISAAFSHDNVAFLRIQFSKQLGHKSLLAQLKPDENERFYWPETTSSDMPWGHVYWDVTLADVAKLRASKWTFQETERGNQKQARELFLCAPYLADPFIFYCPEVPSYRDRKLYLASKLVQRRRGGRVVAYHPMTVQAQADFLARPLTVPPVAEQFLEPTEPDVVRPFVFQDYSRNRWLTALYKVESRLVRIARGIKGIFG